MPTNIDMCNRALLQCGAREQIASLTEGSTSSITCNTLYQPTFEQLARTAQWNCLRTQSSLTLLKAAQGTPENQTGSIISVPPQPWLYEYLLPNDCLQVRYLQPTFSSSSTPPLFPTMGTVSPTQFMRKDIDFVVSTDYVTESLTKVILTNLQTAQIVYTINAPDPSFWDSDFQAAYVASLASALIPPLNLNMQLYSALGRIANDIIAMAKSRDANEGVTVQDHTPDWILARGAGRSFLGDVQGYDGYGDYS